MGYLYWKQNGELTPVPAKDFASGGVLETYRWEKVVVSSG